MVRTVRDPFLHPQEIQKLLVVVDDFEQIEIVFHQRAHRRHLREHRAHEFARQIAVGIDQPVDILGREAAGPQVDEAVPEPVLDRVAVEIDRRDGEDHRS